MKHAWHIFQVTNLTICQCVSKGTEAIHSAVATKVTTQFAFNGPRQVHFHSSAGVLCVKLTQKACVFIADFVPHLHSKTSSSKEDFKNIRHSSLPMVLFKVHCTSAHTCISCWPVMPCRQNQNLPVKIRARGHFTVTSFCRYRTRQRQLCEEYS